MKSGDAGGEAQHIGNEEESTSMQSRGLEPWTNIGWQGWADLGQGTV